MDARQPGRGHRPAVFLGCGTGCRGPAASPHGLAVRHALGSCAVAGLCGAGRAGAQAIENLSTRRAVAGATRVRGVPGVAVERCHSHGSDVRSALRVRPVPRAAGGCGQFLESGASHAYPARRGELSGAARVGGAGARCGHHRRQGARAQGHHSSEVHFDRDHRRHRPIFGAFAREQCARVFAGRAFEVRARLRRRGSGTGRGCGAGPRRGKGAAGIPAHPCVAVRGIAECHRRCRSVASAEWRRRLCCRLALQHHHHDVGARDSRAGFTRSGAHRSGNGRQAACLGVCRRRYHHALQGAGEKRAAARRTGSAPRRCWRSTRPPCGMRKSAPSVFSI